MVASPVRSSPGTRFNLRVLIAFFMIYIVWGSTFIAIRIAVEHMPPLLAAGARFTTAGIALYIWSRLRGNPRPSASEWRNLAVLALLMFVATYSALFWAETKIPSGMASVLVATLPIWTVLLETLVFRRVRFTGALLISVAIGFAGVFVLVFGAGFRGAGWLPCIAILGGEFSWALGSVLAGSLRQPASRTIVAAAEMLIGGGILLLWSVLKGDLNPLPRIEMAAIGALLYLILAGSLMAFTAFVWLLARMPATRVSSHAYINPVVAVILGYWIGGEVFPVRALIGAAIILTSVFLIFRTRAIAH